MQLIVETEAVLDIEKNMSTVEDIQSSKEDDIENLNEKTCNGNNEVKDINTIAMDEDNTKVVDEVESALVNIPVDNDEPELSNVDLSEVISKQSNLNHNEMEESQNHSAEEEINGVSTIEKETINEPEDIPEEDYMEDDIISIREEPYNIISEPQAVIENLVTDIDETNETTVKDNSNIDENNKIKITEETKESCVLIEDNELLDEDKDVIELIDETPDLDDQCEKETVLTTQDEKDDIEIIEESQELPAEHKNDTEPPTDVDKDIEDLEESRDSIDKFEKGGEALVQEVKNENELIEEPNNSTVVSEMEMELLKPKETNNIEKENNTTEIDSSIPCENIITSPIKPPKNDDIDTTTDDKIKTEANGIEQCTLTKCEDNTDHPMEVEENDENTSVDQIKTIVGQTENNSVMSVKKEKDETDITEGTSKVSCVKESDLVIEAKENVKIIEETNVADVMSDDKTGSSLELTTDKPAKNMKYELENEVMNIDNASAVVKDVPMKDEKVEDETKIVSEAVDSPIELRDDMDVDEVPDNTTISELKVSVPINNMASNNTVDKPIICKLSNTLDILSDDDDDEPPKEDPPKAKTPDVEPSKVTSPNVKDVKEKQCINIEDDDDIMLIDEDTSKTEAKPSVDTDNKEGIPVAKPDVNRDSETGEKNVQETSIPDKTEQKEKTPPPVADEMRDSSIDINIKEKAAETTITKPASPTPLVPENFLKTAKKKLADMTRDEIEEFCVLKIVESIVDRSSLSDIKNKLKAMQQGLEEYRKKAMMLTKQNRDLQVVLKSVQEEQKKAMGDTPITPLKITRSVGMQVFMEKTVPRKKGPQQNVNKAINNLQNRNVTSQAPRPQKPVNQQIPVPRLVPANNPALKTPSTIPQINQMNTQNKNSNPPNGLLKNPSPSIKAEKRQHSKMASSVTVDLTDDEPPAKMPGGPKTSPAPPVRLVPPQNLMAPQRQAFATGVNSPRKVYIPISGPQNQALRPGQTIMLKTVPATGMRPRCTPPQVTRVCPTDNNAVRMQRMPTRHPAPLPAGMKQYQPPNWKALPPAPDLKLSKVENGIVISWKIEGIPEDTYEEIASYQLYAYQETSTPPSTTLWKKIGDVKALPLPMACTLTQFMAGFKYYFAVRAVDVRSRLGPFSLPGSILLLSKNI